MKGSAITGPVGKEAAELWPVRACVIPPSPRIPDSRYAAYRQQLGCRDVKDWFSVGLGVFTWENGGRASVGSRTNAIRWLETFREGLHFGLRCSRKSYQGIQIKDERSTASHAPCARSLLGRLHGCRHATVPGRQELRLFWVTRLTSTILSCLSQGEQSAYKWLPFLLVDAASIHPSGVLAGLVHTNRTRLHVATGHQRRPT